MSATVVSDIHSQLNATGVRRLIELIDLDALVETVRSAGAAGLTALTLRRPSREGRAAIRTRYVA